jgi:hypothetical protein
MKRARWFLGIGGGLAALVFALPWLVSAEQFRPAIEGRLRAAAGRPVTFGALSLRVIPLSLRAAGLEIQGLAKVDVLDVHVRFLPLLRGDIEISSLVLTRPVVTYTPAAKGSAGGEAPKLESLRIVDGRLKTGGTEYANIDAEIRMDGPGVAGTLSWENGTLPVQLEFAGARAGEVWDVAKLDAKMGKVTAGFVGKVDMGASTVDGALKIAPSPLAGLPVKTAYKPSGTVTADVKVRGPFKEPVLTGAVQIANLEVTGGQLSQTLKATALELELTPGQIVAKPFSLQVGPTLVQAAFALKDYKTIDATVSTKDAAIRDLLAMAQVSDVKGTGVTTLSVRATGPLAKPVLEGSGSVAGADLQVAGLVPPLKIYSALIHFAEDSAALEEAVFHLGKSNFRGAVKFQNFANPRIAISLQADQLSNVEMAGWVAAGKGGGEGKPMVITGDLAAGKVLLNDLVLENVKTGVVLRDQVLTLEPLSAGVYGGKLTGAATVNLKTQPAVIGLKAHLDKIESEQLLAATTALRKVVSGPVTAEAQLQFAPKPGEEFARTMDGTVQFQLAQGKLIPVNLLGEMGTLAKFLKPLNGAGGTSVLGMKGAFTVAKGVVTTEDLRVELDRAAALFTGGFSLVDQTLNLRMLTTLNKQLSEEVGGTKIGGFLSAAVAGPKGELMMPSLVKGTFSKPVFTPDAVAVGKMKLGSPAGLQEGMKGIMDLFKGKKAAPKP